MKISTVRIRNYRCIKDITVEFDSYTALVGANGAGKSSVLYALDWFFNGRAVSDEDIYVAGTKPDDVVEFMDVQVEFGALSQADRQSLGGLVYGEKAVLRRVRRRGDAKDQLLCTTGVGPGFEAVRLAGSAAEKKVAYKALLEQRPELGLPTASTATAILAALDEWEGDTSNAARLELSDTRDASDWFSRADGLESRHRYLLVPASVDLVDQIGTMGRGSALRTLVGAVLDHAAEVARDEWLETNQPRLDELRDLVDQRVSEVAGVRADRVNAALATYLPDAKLVFDSTLTQVAPNIDAAISTSVQLGTTRHDIARQGHGVQRSVMLALLQALVPDQHSGAGRSGDQPELLIAIEEPEIYQHPSRARALARSVADLSSSGIASVCVATHSPYFVRAEDFEAVRCFRLGLAGTEVSRTTVNAVAQAAGLSNDKIRKRLQQELAGAFSEAFFADAVVLVEGGTDKAVLEVLAERLPATTGLASGGLDAEGIALIDVHGKGGLRIAWEVLRALGVPTYVVFDSDFATGLSEGDEKSKREQTADVVSWLPPLPGGAGFRFGDATKVGPDWAAWAKDIEAELALWPSFDAELVALKSKGKKNSLLYASAARAASLDDVPMSVRDAVQAIRRVGRVDETSSAAAGVVGHISREQPPLGL